MRMGKTNMIACGWFELARNLAVAKTSGEFRRLKGANSKRVKHLSTDPAEDNDLEYLKAQKTAI